MVFCNKKFPNNAIWRRKDNKIRENIWQIKFHLQKVLRTSLLVKIKSIEFVFNFDMTELSSFAMNYYEKNSTLFEQITNISSFSQLSKAMELLHTISQEQNLI